MLNEGNQIHNFISSSGSGTVIIYGSVSDFLTSYGFLRFRFLRFRFRFHNADFSQFAYIPVFQGSAGRTRDIFDPASARS